MTEPTKAYDEKEITLPSGITLELTPLALKNLRKFMLIWSTHIDWVRSMVLLPSEEQPNEIEFTEKQFDVFESLLALSLEKPLKKYDEDNETKTKVKDFIENEIDEKSMYVILKATGGLDLDTSLPNLTKNQQVDQQSQAQE